MPMSSKIEDKWVVQGHVQDMSRTFPTKLQNISALEHMKKSGQLSDELVRRGLTRLKDLVSPVVLDWFKALIDA